MLYIWWKHLCLCCGYFSDFFSCIYCGRPFHNPVCTFNIRRHVDDTAQDLVITFLSNAIILHVMGRVKWRSSRNNGVISSRVVMYHVGAAQDVRPTRESDITESKCLSDMSSLQPDSRLLRSELDGSLRREFERIYSTSLIPTSYLITDTASAYHYHFDPLMWCIHSNS